ncbi:MAG: hypothetical protein ACR2HR_09885 [Euzebya sp.]
MRIDDQGFAVDLPTPWEGAVQRGEVSPAVHRRASDRGVGVQTPPVLHLSTTPLPALRGDFGSGAVDLLGHADVFIAVLDYGQDSVGTALFDTGPMPRTLSSRQFKPDGLQRAIPGQSGYQQFCTENGRALCLYVVLGAHHQARRLVREANQMLSRIQIAAP